MQNNLFTDEAISAAEKMEKRIARVPGIDTSDYKKVIEGMKKSVRFLLPNGGRILDTGLKALPDSLNLPFSDVCLEYTATNLGGGAAEKILGVENTVLCPKRIAYAKQLAPNSIAVYISYYQISHTGKGWFLYPFFAVISGAKASGIDTSLLTPPFNSSPEMGTPLSSMLIGYGSIIEHAMADVPNWMETAAIDLNDEVAAVLSLIEVLSCKNVKIEKAFKKPKKIRTVDKKDSYYNLTVGRSADLTKPLVSHGVIGESDDDSRASPREHLRMGHIRRYETFQIFVQSTIVNPGVGGKVFKNYKVKKTNNK